MLRRLLNAIMSRGTKEKIKDSHMSTSADDMSTIEKAEFDPARVRELMEKCGLLDPIPESNDSKKSEKI